MAMQPWQGILVVLDVLFDVMICFSTMHTSTNPALGKLLQEGFSSSLLSRKDSRLPSIQPRDWGAPDPNHSVFSITSFQPGTAKAVFQVFYSLQKSP